MYDLAGKVALVTGTGNRRGIGRAIAVRLAREGADVAVNDKPLPPGANPWGDQQDWRGVDSVAEEIRAIGRRSIAVPADITDRAQVQAMVDRVVAELGRIDILVNNAKWLEPIDEDGGTSKTNVLDMTDEMWCATLAVNLTGPLHTCQAAARQMIRQGEGGKIINIASLKGKRGKEGRSAVCASKGGLIRLTETLALELGRYNINVNAICPGVTRTELGARNAVTRAAERGITVEAMQAEQEATIPIRRANTPEDIAAMAVFLASPGARNITGQSYNVDVGLVPS
jgi:NAD(P)-dependent dehydrogenase (short-subunit alcohol dehydrogenase family)